MELSEQKKQNIKKGIGVTVVAAAAIFIQQFYFGVPSFDQKMMQVASEINKACPIMVDRDTRFDNAMALTDNVFQYNYTLVNIEKSSLDVEQFENSLTPILINSFKTNPDIKVFREAKTTIACLYKDKNGVFLAKILITADLYANPQ